MKSRSVVELYRAFLSGIDKDFIGTVTPEKFNFYMSEAMVMLRRELKEKASIDTIAVDGLSALLHKTTGYITNSSDVIIDSNHTYTVHNGAYASSGRFVIKSLFVSDTNNDSTVNDSHTNIVYLPFVDGSTYTKKVHPLALKMLGVIVYYDDSTLGIPCFPILSDELSSIRNVFRRPNDNKCYYEVVGEQMIFYVKNSVRKIRIEFTYLKNPFDLYFDRNNPADADYPYRPLSEGENTLFPYQAGYGSINPRLPYAAEQKLLDYALQEYAKSEDLQSYQASLRENLNLKG